MFGLVFLLILTPIALGYLLRRLMRLHLRGYSLLFFVLGFLAMLAQFALVCYPATWRDWPFHSVVFFIGAVYGAECLLALALWALPRRRARSAAVRTGSLWMRVKERLLIWVRSPWFWAVVIICGFQILRLLLGQSYEPRDSKTYNALINDIWYGDHFFRVIPETGRRVSSPLDLRLKFILSAWYAFVPMIAKISGWHPLVISNTVLPPYLVLLYYLLIYTMALFLFRQDRKAAWTMTAVCALLHEFTVNVSIQSQILLLWPAWGKSVLARLVMPSILLIYALYTTHRERCSHAGFICVGLMLSVAGCSLSTMAAIALPLAWGLLGVICAVRQRRFMPVLTGVIVCIPAFVYSICYYLLSSR